MSAARVRRGGAAALARRLGLPAAALLVAALLAPTVAAQPVQRTALEAAYVMNFLNYSEWPSMAAADTPGEVTVLVLGSPTVVRTFRATAETASTRGTRPVRVRGMDPRRLDDPRQLQRLMEDVHAVFVADADPVFADAVIEAARGRPILTIGEGRAFVQRGGMLAFLREGRNLVFTSNVQAVIDSPVTLSSKVLRLAREPTGLPSEGAHGTRIEGGLALRSRPAAAVASIRARATG